MPPNKRERKIKLKRLSNPVKINEDVWFYQLNRRLDFVVWQRGRDGKMVCTQFRLLLKRLDPHIDSSNPK